MFERPDMRTVESVQDWIIKYLVESLSIDPADVDLQEPFHSYGLSSREAVSLSGDLEEWAKCSLSPTVLWDYPSIVSLAAYVFSLRQGSVQQSVQKEDISLSSSLVASGEPVAIIGIGCRFPGAQGPEAFWQLLCDGLDQIREVDDGRWSNEQFYDPDPSQPGKTNSRWGGFLEDVDQFDASFFGISPREAMMMDPQQRLLLEVAWEALEDAGLNTRDLVDTDTGVFMGIATNDYGRMRSGDTDHIDAYTPTGAAFSIAANRLSYFFDWHGPSMAIDTACSSSLVAVHLACQSLRSGEATLVCAGGVNLVLEPTYTIGLTKAGALSPRGRCQAFDEGADGYVRGEGVGLVVLKPLALAQQDGDHIYAVIRGSAMNQDGRTNGLMAPDQRSQERVIARAYRQAGIAPHMVQYIEAHGTGTLLGDPIEAQALGKVLSQGRSPTKPCRVGSVKTNIGHLEAAAGIAGLIKVALAMEHRKIPPTLHFQHPNPYIAFEQLMLHVQSSLDDWVSGDDPMIAGVSSFGFGGTNAHVVLAEAPLVASHDQDKFPAPQPRLLSCSAHSPESLLQLLRRYQETLRYGQASWAAICATAGSRRTHLSYRAALIADSSSAALNIVQEYLEHGQSKELITNIGSVRTRSGVVFVFSGQGAQWVGMGRQLWQQEPIFRRIIADCDQAMLPFVSWSVVSVLLECDETQLQQIDILQPLLFAVQIALAGVLESWGISPDAVVGHSMGEVAAAYVAGALSLADACRVICRRSTLLRHVSGQGSMLAVELPLTQLQKHLAVCNEEVVVAVYNSPTSLVLSGSSDALERINQYLQGHGVYCRHVAVDVAAHSPQMEALSVDLFTLLRDIVPQPVRIPFYSTVHGCSISAVGESLDAMYWCRNLREPVRLTQTIEQMVRDGYGIFLEVSPHPVLTPALEQNIVQLQSSAVATATLRRFQDDRASLLMALGVLYTSGVNLRWEYCSGPAVVPVRLPMYPWQHQCYWIAVQAQGSVDHIGHPGESTHSVSSVANLPSTPERSSIRSAIASYEADEQKLFFLQTHLCEHVAHVVRMSPADIDPEISLMTYGFDSILALELRKRLQESLLCVLPVTFLWQYPTIYLLTECLYRLVVSSQEVLDQL